MMTAQCFICQWYIGNNEKGIISCKGFPDGIPEDIIIGEFDHRYPHDGDQGYRFEPIDLSDGAVS